MIPRLVQGSRILGRCGDICGFHRACYSSALAHPYESWNLCTRRIRLLEASSTRRTTCYRYYSAPQSAAAQVDSSSIDTSPPDAVVAPTTTRTSQIQELLQRPIASWDESMYELAEKLILDYFSQPVEDFKTNQNTNNSGVNEEHLLLIKRLCQERQFCPETSKFVNKFLSTSGKLVEELSNTLTRSFRNKFLPQSHRQQHAATALAGDVHSAVHHIIQNRYWQPDTTNAYKALILLAATSNQPTQAEAWLNAQHRKSRYQHNRLDPPDRHDHAVIVSALARSNEVDAAQRACLLVRKLQKGYSGGIYPKMKPTESCYVGWISTLTANAKDRSAAAFAAEQVLVEIWQRSKTDQFYPSTAIYNAVIQAYAVIGKAHKAETLLGEMSAKALQCNEGNRYCMPDVTSFSSVIAAWSKSRVNDAPERAEKLLQLMQDFATTTGRKNCQPNAVTMAAVLNCWAKSNHPNAPARAEAILRRMQEHAAAGNNAMRPTFVIYNICMNCWARSGYDDAPARVEALFRELVEQYQKHGSSCKPDHVSYMSRISAWQRIPRNRTLAAVRATAVLDEMIATNDPSIYPNQMHFAAVIAAWQHCDNAVQAEATLERMLDAFLNKGKKQCAPSVHAFNFVLSAWSRQCSPEGAKRAMQLLDRMQELAETTELGVKPTDVSFNTCLSALSKSGSEDAFEQTKALQRRMEEAGIRLDKYSYGALVQAVSRSSQDKSQKALNARAILDEMIRAEIRPNAVVRVELERCGVVFIRNAIDAKKSL